MAANPFEAGRDAALSGRNGGANPHKLYSKPWMRWVNGWQAGRFQLEREKAAAEAQRPPGAERAGEFTQLSLWGES